jgi:hypothetical protein
VPLSGRTVHGNNHPNEHPDCRETYHRRQQISAYNTPVTTLRSVGQTDTQPSRQHQDSSADHGHDEVTQRPPQPSGWCAQDQIGLMVDSSLSKRRVELMPYADAKNGDEAQLRCHEGFRQLTDAA